MMNSVIKIFCMGSVALLLHSCSNGHSTTPQPQSNNVFDSTKFVAPGIANEVTMSNTIFIDTGQTIVVKGTGFDPKLKNDYFLMILNSDTKPKGSDSLISIVINKKKQVKDTNLVSITNSEIIFKLSAHSLYKTNFDSVYVYFTKLKRNSIYTDASSSFTFF